jgi:hypothetical protein
MKITNDLLDRHHKDIEIISKQRRYWLFSSSIVMIAIVGVIAGWDATTALGSKSVWWLVVTSMLLVSANWWYWTMQVVRKLILHQKNEMALIAELVDNIHSIREDVSSLRRLSIRNIDNDK